MGRKNDKKIDEVGINLLPNFEVEAIIIKHAEKSLSSSLAVAMKKKEDEEENSKIPPLEITFQTKKRRGNPSDTGNENENQNGGTVGNVGRRKFELISTPNPTSVAGIASVAAAAAVAAVTDQKSNTDDYDNYVDDDDSGDNKDDDSATVPLFCPSKNSIVQPEDRKLMSDHSYFILQQLQFCRRAIDTDDDEEDKKSSSPATANMKSSTASGSTQCGFECTHCQGKTFRRFPTAIHHVKTAYIAFRNHLAEECLDCPNSMRDEVTSWEYCPPEKTLNSLAKWILNRVSGDLAGGGLIDGNGSRGGRHGRYGGGHCAGHGGEDEEEEEAVATMRMLAQKKRRREHSVLEKIA